MIRWCLMHVVHLGLLFVCNGSALILVVNNNAVFNALLCIMCGCSACDGTRCVGLIGRNLLLRAGAFGDEENISVSVKLARAYVRFKRFISSKKIECSQPQFTEKQAPKLTISAHKFCIWDSLSFIDLDLLDFLSEQMVANLTTLKFVLLIMCFSIICVLPLSSLITLLCN